MISNNDVIAKFRWFCGEINSPISDGESTSYGLYLHLEGAKFVIREMTPSGVRNPFGGTLRTAVEMWDVMDFAEKVLNRQRLKTIPRRKFHAWNT